mgnify:CR=1 FL=1|tara:strand:- start:701 stop:943 length:243 start_codon:yes stop_codon:yes gene_type:complete
MKISKARIKEIIREELGDVNEGGYPFIDLEGKGIYEKMEELKKFLLPASEHPRGHELLINIMKEFLELQTSTIKNKTLDK